MKTFQKMLTSFPDSGIKIFPKIPKSVLFPEPFEPIIKLCVFLSNSKVKVFKNIIFTVHIPEIYFL